MKLHFDPNQGYQLDAIRAVTDVFAGQELSHNDTENVLFDTGSAGSVFSENGFGNKLNIHKEQILLNVRSVQERNNIETAGSELQGMNFSVEMETGTGKTYVYLRTVYELNRLYGFCKFAIVVPSVAIREGVLKNLQITHEHFQSRYENVCLSFGVYDSKKVSSLRNFATSNAIQILVMNIDAFAKDDNIINKPNDKLSGKTPMEFIKATNPIVIVDEPQNMETENRKLAIQNLNPLCTLRYSATHTNLYNLVYSLNPVRAYDLGLVKQIEVYSAVGENAMNDAFIRVESIKHSGKSKIVAKVSLDVNTDKGVRRKTVTVGGHEYDLFKLSGEREIYRDLFVEGIDVFAKAISLSNGQTISVGEARGGLSEVIQREMIRMAVEEHLKKEKLYADRGIKVLTLFFVDRVRNYRDYDGAGNAVNGKFAQWFEEAYREEINKPKYAAIKKFDAKDVHDGYFSQDGKGKIKDTGGETLADDDTYKLIMQEKERLLSMETPLRFIFSHSALREGWDNPNVFQICTLNETKSDLKKRQEIGRGLRLCVDSDGNRVHGKDVNRLTVIANESYEDFAKALQEEIQDDCGVNFIGRIKNRRERVKVNYRKGFEIDEKFLEIWERIRHKTKYRVGYNTGDLIREAGRAVREMSTVCRPSVNRSRAGVIYSSAGVYGELLDVYTSAEYGVGGRIFFDLPDFISYIQNKTDLTRQTVVEIIRESGRLVDVIVNPQMFMDNAVTAIKKALHKLMIGGIKYEKIGREVYEMTLFNDSGLEIYLDELLYMVKNPDKTIYADYIPLDSSVESQFAADCETFEKVKFYFKLPNWFKISTPIGTYNPDWAVVFEDDKKVYFVAETKGKDAELRGSEDLRIACGMEYVKALGEGEVQYERVSTLTDLVGQIR